MTPVPVDAKRLDWPRLVANGINALRALYDALVTRLEGVEARSGFGWADYTDNDAPAPLALSGGSTVQVSRNLSASGANYRLRGPFAAHQFWDNATDTIRARALYDVIDVSIYLKVIPGASGGTLDVQLMAGAIDIGSKSFEMTGPVGVGKGIRADFKITCRSAFLTNGAKVMLTPSVTTQLVEFSPEFFPADIEP